MSASRPTVHESVSFILIDLRAAHDALDRLSRADAAEYPRVRAELDAVNDAEFTRWMRHTGGGLQHCFRGTAEWEDRYRTELDRSAACPRGTAIRWLRLNGETDLADELAGHFGTAFYAPCLGADRPGDPTGEIARQAAERRRLIGMTEAVIAARGMAAPETPGGGGRAGVEVEDPVLHNARVAVLAAVDAAEQTGHWRKRLAEAISDDPGHRQLLGLIQLATKDGSSVHGFIGDAIKWRDAREKRKRPPTCHKRARR